MSIKKKYTVSVIHEFAPRKTVLLKNFDIWVDMESERDNNEFVYAQVRLAEG